MRGLDQVDRTALASAALLWAFGYAMVVAIVLLARSGGELLEVAAEFPVFLLAVPLAFGLYRAMRALQPSPFPVRLLCAGLFVVGAALLLSFLNLRLLAWYDPASASATPRLLSGRFLGYFWAMSLNASIFWGHLATARVKAQAEALAQAQGAAERAQLSALRFQLNPHFLFNTLNALSAMVMEAGAKDAEAMISRLSDFLRASLAADPAAMVTLEEELQIVQAYLEIESVRFGDRLAVDFDCEDAVLDALVPNFILQPLVENAVKYAVAPARRPVTLSIAARREAEDLVIAIGDTGPGEEAAAVKPGTGLGLRNVRDRLAAAYGEEGALQTGRREGGFLATLRLPLRIAAPAREPARAS